MRRIFVVRGIDRRAYHELRIDVRVCLDHDHPADDLRRRLLIRGAPGGEPGSCFCSKSWPNAFSPGTVGEGASGADWRKVEGRAPALEAALPCPGVCKRKRPRTGNARATLVIDSSAGPQVRESAVRKPASPRPATMTTHNLGKVVRRRLPEPCELLPDRQRRQRAEEQRRPDERARRATAPA